MARRLVLSGLVMLVSCTLRASSAAQAETPGLLDLDQALAYALDHSFAIKQARERIREQEGIVTTITAAALPSVAATATAQKSNLQSFQAGTQNSGQPVIIPSGRYWRMNVTARQAIYAGGGIRSSIKSAAFMRDAAILALQETINATLLDVRTRFYAVLLAREDIKVQEQNLELLQQQLRYATSHYDVGAVSRFEQLRAEVSLANARPALIKARNDLRLAVVDLRKAVGMPPDGDDPEIVGALTFSPVAVELLPALTAAKEGRPELQRLSRLLRAAEAGEITARADYFPNLAVTAGGELRKGPSESFGDSLKGWRAGAQVAWNGSPRATAGRVAQAVSLIEEARLALGAAELSVQVEVRRAISTLEEARELVNASGQSVKQAEEAVRMALSRYRTGNTPQLDLLQSQVALTAARTNQLRATYNHNVAQARLRYAVGQSEIEYGDSPSPTSSSAVSISR